MVWQKTSAEDLLCVFFLSRETVSLRVSLSLNKLCVREANFAKLNHRRVLSHLSSCYIVSKVPEFTAKSYSAMKHQSALKLNTENRLTGFYQY